MDQQTLSRLADVFASFCAFGSGARAKPELDSAKFAKLCRDSRLLDRYFTATDADLLFTRTKPKGERVIGFHAFQQECIPQIAARKRVDPQQVIDQLIDGHSGPSVSGTYADSVPLHDDRNTYTGVYKRGGPSTNDLATSDLSFITNRQDADVRGVNSPTRQRSDSGFERRPPSGRGPVSPRGGLDPADAPQALTDLLALQRRGVPCLEDAIAHVKDVMVSPQQRPARSPPDVSLISPREHSSSYRDPAGRRSSGGRGLRDSARRTGSPMRTNSGGFGSRSPQVAPEPVNWRSEDPARMLEELFNSFCAFGAGQRGAAEMDNAKFAKFCRETRIIDRRFTTTDVDLVFSKVKPKGGRTIDFHTFRDRALAEVAQRKGQSVAQVLGSIRGGPRSSGTVAGAVPLHDDVGTYTGVYKAGGPTNVDLATSDLAYITNRAPADVRGVQYQQ